ncbi:hypothetical protein ACFTZM_18375 [Streptomyces hydrogenans]|uniref:hypothetical protein n=1 Tax=Streptomyces hydrogenans TaxID=1873719 RepID=UPI00362C3228
MVQRVQTGARHGTPDALAPGGTGRALGPRGTTGALAPRATADTRTRTRTRTPHGCPRALAPRSSTDTLATRRTAGTVAPYRSPRALAPRRGAAASVPRRSFRRHSVSSPPVASPPEGASRNPFMPESAVDPHLAAAIGRLHGQVLPEVPRARHIVVRLPPPLPHLPGGLPSHRAPAALPKR